MTDLASPASPNARHSFAGPAGRLRRLALSPTVFFALAALAGVVLAASLLHTARALMRDEPRPGFADTLDTRVRLRTPDTTSDDRSLAVATRTTPAH